MSRPPPHPAEFNPWGVPSRNKWINKKPSLFQSLFTPAAAPAAAAPAAASTWFSRLVSPRAAAPAGVAPVETIIKAANAKAASTRWGPENVKALRAFNGPTAAAPRPVGGPVRNANIAALANLGNKVKGANKASQAAANAAAMKIEAMKKRVNAAGAAREAEAQALFNRGNARTAALLKNRNPNEFSPEEMEEYRALMSAQAVAEASMPKPGTGSLGRGGGSRKNKNRKNKSRKNRGTRRR